MLLPPLSRVRDYPTLFVDICYLKSIDICADVVNFRKETGRGLILISTLRRQKQEDFC